MKYDVAIIGAGPAGMTAGIFASRGGLKTVCFEQMAVGGNMNLAYEIVNYPGFEAITGFELANRLEQHAKSLGVEFIYESVKSVNKNEDGFLIKTNKNKILANKLILASGGKTKKLDVPNEQKFIGRGISYCASCDGNFFKNQSVAVIGGGKTALEDVKYLSNLVRKIYLINRSDKFKFDTNELDKLESKCEISSITNADVVSVDGDELVESLTIKRGNKKQTIKLSAVFVAIGSEPDLDYVKFDLALTNAGFIKVNKNQATNVKNVYACGDVTNSRLKQIITACASGAIAGNSCVEG